MIEEPRSTEIAIAPQPSAAPALLRPIVRVDEMVEAHKDLAKFIQGSLEKGRDFGEIPGTGSPSLLKPGAERLLIGFGCVAEFEIMEQDVDHNHANTYVSKKWIDADPPLLENGRTDKQATDAMKAAGTHRWRKGNDGWIWQEAMTESGESLGLYRYAIRAILKHRATGEVVGTGVGSCSSMESKYIRAPRDAENTILKMAKKRALIDAVLTTFGLSDRFTQDVEDMEENRAANSGQQTEPTQTAKNPTKVQTPDQRNAAKWLKELELTVSETKEINALCKTRGVKLSEICIEAMNVGVTTSDQLRAYIEDGEIPTDAEFSQDDDQGELTPTGIASGTGETSETKTPTSSDDDPYADEQDQPALEVAQ